MSKVSGRGQLCPTPDGYLAICMRCTLEGPVARAKQEEAVQWLVRVGWQCVDGRWFCGECVAHYQAINRMRAGVEPFRGLPSDEVGVRRPRGRRLFPELPLGVELSWFVFELPDGTITKDRAVAIKLRRQHKPFKLIPRSPEEIEAIVARQQNGSRRGDARPEAQKE